MSRPCKPVELVKSHRSNKEKQARSESEKALATEETFKEWEETKNSIVAHKLFVRLSGLFAKIKKNDALLETTINRYCLLHSDVKVLEVRKDKVMNLIQQTEDDDDIDITDKVKTLTNLYKILNGTDTKIMQKHTMMLAIEKENIMTIASQLRSIPKKVVEDVETDPMESFLRIVK